MPKKFSQPPTPYPLHPNFGFSAKRETLGFSAKREAGGFTLIELMVVIAIIALVFGIVITSSNVVKKNSRDAKRQSDLRAIQSALEQYKADNIYYPPYPLYSTSTPSFSFNGKTYLNNLPLDPSDNSQYVYQAISYAQNSPTTPIVDQCNNSTNGNCITYCLYAKLENPPNPAPPITTSACANPPSGYNLLVTQP